MEKLKFEQIQPSEPIHSIHDDEVQKVENKSLENNNDNTISRLDKEIDLLGAKMLERLDTLKNLQLDPIKDSEYFELSKQASELESKKLNLVISN